MENISDLPLVFLFDAKPFVYKDAMRESYAASIGLNVANAEVAVILDKSYVQAAKPSDIQELCLKNKALMPDMLFYEMLSADEPGRSRCFAKFPCTENPVIIVPSIGELLRYEFANHRASGPPSAHAKEIRFRFDPNLSATSYEFSAEAATVMHIELRRLNDEVASLIQMVNMAPRVFPDVFSGSDSSRLAARRQIESEIATNPGPVVQLYSLLTPPRGTPKPPTPAMLDPSWTLFRSLQVKLLATLDLGIRYGTLPAQPGIKRHTEIEHHMFDMQYAMLGALEGALATNDNWMRDIWKKMCPTGVLFEH